MSSIKWIWWVVGLMVFAIAGIVWMQVSWIKENIRVVEDQFDKEVYSALNRVITDMEEEQGGLGSPSELKDVLGEGRTLDTLITTWSDLFTAEELDEIKDSEIDLTKLKELIETAAINKSRKDEWKNKRVTDLINLEELDNSIRYNLRSRGIRTDYHYGVLSNRDNNFVIMDGNYVVFPDENVEATITEHNLKLMESPYAANIFRHDGDAMGKLIIEFPVRNRFIFASSMASRSGRLLAPRRKKAGSVSIFAAHGAPASRLTARPDFGETKTRSFN